MSSPGSFFPASSDWWSFASNALDALVLAIASRARMAGFPDRYYGRHARLYDPVGDCYLLRHRNLQMSKHGLAYQLMVRAGLSPRVLPDLRVAP
jgi:hypothetical protein